MSLSLITRIYFFNLLSLNLKLTAIVSWENTISHLGYFVGVISKFQKRTVGNRFFVLLSTTLTEFAWFLWSFWHFVEAILFALTSCLSHFGRYHRLRGNFACCFPSVNALAACSKSFHSHLQIHKLQLATHTVLKLRVSTKRAIRSEVTWKLISAICSLTRT